ncbi:MAG TPA: SGNH/GDSL hydrolase family protein [Sandaracinaceae bacterium LLY-WYZ-13_1]|nr:SGNH/GDSL hydrolase family protein [Sandaracinaceae bacterium LLY-WYZ-13_1]
MRALRPLAPFVLLALSLPAGRAHARDGVDGAPERATPGVFIVGDSHVQMLGPMLTNRLEEAGVRVLGHEARPGWSTLRYQRRGDLREVLEAAGRPEVVVVSLGGNDIPASAEAYEAQLRWVVTQARAAGARHIVWLGPATSDASRGERARVVGARHERNADWQRALLPRLGVTWVDSRPMTRRHHGRDGVHFTRAGYRAWSAGVLSDVTVAVAVEAGDRAVGAPEARDRPS